MRIWIPTRGRYIQTTYNSLPPEIQKEVAFVVSHKEDPENLPEGAKWVHSHTDGIAAKRQWIIDNSPDKCIMLDDDLVFATRRDDDPTKFLPSTGYDIVRLFSNIDGLLDRFCHVGVSCREGANRDTVDTVVNSRILRVHGFGADVLRREGVRFDRLEFMTDFDVTLQLLEKGYANIRINWIVQNQKSSNAPGGCSLYRTIDKLRESAIELMRLHPQFVKLVEKETKGAWNGQPRTDVRIAWKAAFDSAGKVAVLDSRTQPDNVEERPGATETVE